MNESQSGSMFLSEPYVHEPGKHSGDQEDDHQNEVNAFDLLLVDHAQEMVMAEICFLPQNAEYIMRFKYSDAHEPQNGEHQTSLRDGFLGRRVHAD